MVVDDPVAAVTNDLSSFADDDQGGEWITMVTYTPRSSRNARIMFSTMYFCARI